MAEEIEHPSEEADKPTLAEALDKYGMPLVHAHASEEDRKARRLTISLWFGDAGSA